MVCELVGSAAIAASAGAETHRTTVARFQIVTRAVVERRYDGSIVSFDGDRVVASFGHPVARENDADRAVRAGLDLLAAIRPLTEEIAREHGETVAVRVALHHGAVSIDVAERDVTGSGAEVVADLASGAEPGTLLVSDQIKRLVGDRFEFVEHPPRPVSGAPTPVVTYTVLGQRDTPSAGSAAGPMVGRAAELATLEAHWDRARAGERWPGECVTVVGEAGIGKSRLAAALIEHVGRDGGQVVEVVGSPREIDSGLWPVRRLIEDRSGIARGADSNERLHLLRTHIATLGLAATLLAPLAALLGIPARAGYEPIESDARQLRDAIDDAAFAYVRACFHERAGLLVCEDAHWFDAPTRALVARAVRELPPAVLTAVTSRDTEFVPKGPHVSAVTLAPLGYDAARQLLAAFGVEDLSGDDVRDIVARAEGVPLYLEELVRTSLYGPLLSRLDESAAGAALAAAAATIGRDADRALLAAVSGLREADFDDALRRLLDGAILERTAEQRYRFRHEVLREAAYALQPAADRPARHGRVADAIVAGASDADAIEWHVVADHYEAAGRRTAAADAFERASATARQRGALAEAKLLLSRAIDMVVADPEAGVEREVALRLRRGFLSLSMEGNSSADAATDYERCLELVMDAASDEMFSTLISLWAYYMSRAELGRATQVLDSLSGTEAARALAQNGMLEGAYGLVAWYRGEFDAAFERFEVFRRQVADATPETDYSRWWFIPIDTASAAHMTAALSFLMVGDVKRALPEIEAARAVAGAIPFPQGPFTTAANASFEAWAYAELDDLDRALAIVDEIADLAARHGFDSWSMVAVTQRDVFEGLRLARAEPSAENASTLAARAGAAGAYMTMWKTMDQWVFVPYYTTIKGVLSAAAGDRDGAVTALEEARDIAARTGMRFYDAESLRHQARLRPTADERAAGFREANALARSQGAALFELRAAIDLFAETGDASALRDAVDRFDTDVSFPTLDHARRLIA